LNRLDELEGEFRKLCQVRREGSISADEYCIRLNEIGLEYIKLLDEFPTPEVPQPMKVEAAQN